MKEVAKLLGHHGGADSHKPVRAVACLAQRGSTVADGYSGSPARDSVGKLDHARASRFGVKMVGHGPSYIAIREERHEGSGGRALDRRRHA